MTSGMMQETMQMTPNNGGPRFRPYASPNHQVTKGRYITSNDPRGYIPVYEYPLNGQWIMMDIDDGYILWTGIWKALGNSKADIVKMIDSQPDLAQVIRRVRGGYLKIQGTWMPYEVALRLSRRVAWPIKEDLIPLFGPTFPTTCLSPDQPGYGQVVNTGSGRRRSRRPATAPNPSPAAPMLLHEPRDNPTHPSWTVVSSNGTHSKGQPLGSPPVPHMNMTTYENHQPSLLQYRRGSLSHHQQGRGLSDRSPINTIADLDTPVPVSSNAIAAASWERGERVERPPPSASVRYSPYLGHNTYVHHQHKIGRRSFSSLSRTSGSADGTGSGEVSGGANSPVAVDLPSLTIQEPISSRPSLQLKLPSIRNGSTLSPTETSPIVTYARPNSSILSRSRSLGQVDKITLPPLRGPLSACAAPGGLSPIAADSNAMPYALPPISALEDLRGVHAHDSAAVLRRLTADDEVCPHGPILSSRTPTAITLQPHPPGSRRQNASPTSDYYSRYSHNISDAEHSQSRHDSELSAGRTSPLSPTTPPSVFKDVNHSFSTHTVLVREPADPVPMHPSLRHQVSGVRNSRDGSEEEGTTSDVDMDFMDQEKNMGNAASKDRNRPTLFHTQEGAIAVATLENNTAKRLPHRPW